MGVQGGNFEINSGLLLSSFILNYLIVRVIEKEFEEGKIKRTEEGRTSERERTKRKAKLW